MTLNLTDGALGLTFKFQSTGQRNEERCSLPLRTHLKSYIHHLCLQHIGHNLITQSYLVVRTQLKFWTSNNEEEVENKLRDVQQFLPWPVQVET